MALVRGKGEMHMRYRFAAVTALTATVIGGAAGAQESNYSTYGMSYGTMGSTLGDSDIFRLSFSGEYDTNPFLLSGGFSATGIDGPLGTIEQYRVDALVGYLIEPQLMLYLDAEATHTGGVGTETLISPGIEHTREKRTLGFYIEGDSNTLPTTVAYYGYRFSEETEVSFEVNHNDISDTIVYTLMADHKLGQLDLTALWMGEDTAPFNIIGFRGTYDFDNRFRLLTGAMYFEDGISAIKTYDFGAGYELNEDMWLDAVYTSVEGDTITDDIFVVGIRFELGEHRLLRTRIEDARASVVGFFAP